MLVPVVSPRKIFYSFLDDPVPFRFRERVGQVTGNIAGYVLQLPDHLHGEPGTGQFFRPAFGKKAVFEVILLLGA